MDDFEAEQARHKRRVMLMNMQGDCNRTERRMHLLWVIAAVLFGLAIVCGAAGAGELHITLHQGQPWYMNHYSPGPQIIEVNPNVTQADVDKAIEGQRRCEPVYVYFDDHTEVHPAQGCLPRVRGRL